MAFNSCANAKDFSLIDPTSLSIDNVNLYITEREKIKKDFAIKKSYFELKEPLELVHYSSD